MTGLVDNDYWPRCRGFWVLAGSHFTNLPGYINHKK